MNKEELRKWMNTYHDEWIKAHNKLVDIKKILEEDINILYNKEKECWYIPIPKK